MAARHTRLLLAHGSAVLWHLHGILVGVHLGGTWRRVSWRRVVVVQGWRVGPCAVGARAVRLLLSVGLCGVEREVVLGHLAVFPAVGIGHKPLVQR